MAAIEQMVQEELRSWRYTMSRIKRLEEEIAEMEIGITARYEMSGVSARGASQSKIESFCIRKEKKEAELAKLRKVKDALESAVRNGCFTEIERDILGLLMDGANLREYAKRKGIYKSYVYKIKDRAIMKLARYIKESTF